MTYDEVKKRREELDKKIVEHLNKEKLKLISYSEIDHTHCPHRGSPCGIEGKHRCCLCTKLWTTP